MERVDLSKAYKFIKKPAKLTMAVVQDKDGKFNLITLEWFMKTSIKPPMFAISIGHSRYSYDCLQENRFFNLCYPSREMKDLVLLSGTRSGRDIDKLRESGEKWFPGRFKGLPVLAEAVANFECRTVTQVRSGDHTIYVGEIKYCWINEDKELLLFQHLGI